MLADIEKTISIAHDAEVEADRVRHARLPNIAGLVVLLGTKRRVTNILNKEGYLFTKCLAYSSWKLYERTVKPRRCGVFHFSRCAISSSTVLNGPDILPSLSSFKLASSQRGNFFCLCFVGACVVGAVLDRRTGIRCDFSCRISRTTFSKALKRFSIIAGWSCAYYTTTALSGRFTTRNGRRLYLLPPFYAFHLFS